MGINFNAEFTKLNTNTQGASANVLDAEECKAAKNSIWTVNEGMNAEQFKEANQHCSEYDTNKDGIVTVKEQKASIADQLKNVWRSCIARFFKDDIEYNDGDSNAAKNITKQVQARIQNCLNYIEYAKNNNVDIFNDNTGTGVDDTDGEITEYTNGHGEARHTTLKVISSKANSDGTYTNTKADGSTTTWSANSLRISETIKDGKWEASNNYKYNEDGSYTVEQKFKDNSAYHMAQNQNDQFVGSYFVTAKGNYKAHAKQGETIDQTLTRLGITNPADVAAIKKANPKAAAKGYFMLKNQNTEAGDVYIPKEVIANMKKNGTYDENKLMSA